MSAASELHVSAVEYARRRMNEARDRARDSLRVHMMLAHTTDVGEPVVSAEHHLEWIRVLEDEHDFRYVILITPPGYAKTTFGNGWVAWEQGRSGGTQRIGMISNTATQAVGNSKAVRAVIEEPVFRKLYPNVQPDYDRGWGESQWFLTKCPPGSNPSVFASGIGGPMQGKRFDKVLLDDPTTWIEATSDTVMESQRAWLKGTLMQRFPVGRRPPFGTGTRFVGVLTRWGENDLVPTFRDLGFKVIRQPAIGYWDRMVICSSAACGKLRARGLPWPADRDDEKAMAAARASHEKCLMHEHVFACQACGDESTPKVEYGDEPLWQEVEPIEQLEAEREFDNIMFELTKQGNAGVLAGHFFPSNYLRGPAPSIDQYEQVVQGVDTAGGRDQRKGDFFAMVTIGLMPDGHVWVLDVDRDRYSSPDQEARIIANWETWSRERPVDLIAIEDSSAGSMIYDRLVRSTRLPLRPVVPSSAETKQQRAVPLANAYRAGIVHHQDGFRWTARMEAELESFPRGAHDDVVDALAIAYNETGIGPQIRSIG
jgi:predicted phage terminase large subunit-like protein